VPFSVQGVAIATAVLRLYEVASGIDIDDSASEYDLDEEKS